MVSLMYICVPFVCSICIVKRGCWSHWNLSYRQLWAAFQVLGVVPGSSLRAASAFIFWAIFPALPSSCWCLVATVPERLWSCCYWSQGCLRTLGMEHSSVRTLHVPAPPTNGSCCLLMASLPSFCFWRTIGEFEELPYRERLWEHFNRRQLSGEVVFYWVIGFIGFECF